MNRRDWIKLTTLAGLAAGLPNADAGAWMDPGHPSVPAGLSGDKRRKLARDILADTTLRNVHEMARKLMQGGLNAGMGYGTTWIRDMNTFLNIAMQVNPPERFREALGMFLRFQGPDGDVIDCFIERNPVRLAANDRTSVLAPGYVGSKNTVETDQESSLVQAVAKYIAFTGDASILEERIGHLTFRERLAWALDYVLSERFDNGYGLVWGGTTIDWGDVQPEGLRGVTLDSNSHLAFSIYDNAMLMIALNDYIPLPGLTTGEKDRWDAVRSKLRLSIRKHLWDDKNQKFLPHVYLHGSPFPNDFDENAIYYHGGTAVAIEADLLTPSEVQHACARMEQDVRSAGASSIGLNIYPPYPLGYFKNPQLTVPYTYQNGGDWSWFGGRMVQQLVRYGFAEEAYRNLRPMVDRVLRVGDFHEWWTRDNQPRGSAQFRGSAGVLGWAIEVLTEWAQRQSASYGKPRALP